MYFLGTPHRGADSAQIARIIRYAAGHGSKAYLDDLVPGSGALNVGPYNTGLRSKHSQQYQDSTANIH
jgi:hypothetical protein